MAGGIRNHLVNRIDMFIVCHLRNYDEKYYFGWYFRSLIRSHSHSIASSYFIYILLFVSVLDGTPPASAGDGTQHTPKNILRTTKFSPIPYSKQTIASCVWWNMMCWWWKCEFAILHRTRRDARASSIEHRAFVSAQSIGIQCSIHLGTQS